MFLLFKFFIYSTFIRLTQCVFLKDNREQQNLLLLKENQLLRRKLKKVKFTNSDRLFYIALRQLISSALDKMILVKPETILKWHKKLVKRKWNYSNRRRVVRPKTNRDVHKLICEIKNLNYRWGYRRIMGELKKLGLKISKTTISNILKENGYLPPARKSISW